MAEKFRNKYLYNKTQIVEINRSGNVIKSDDLIYKIKSNSTIFDFHPFFQTFEYLLNPTEEKITFTCVHIDIKSDKKIIDVVLHTGNKKENPTIILFDFTEHYNNFQSVAQEKNESILNFHLEELKTRQLEVEKEFKNKFLANVSHDLKTPIWGTDFFLNMLGKTKLTNVQKDYINTIKETNKHIFRLVEDLIDISKIESGTMNIINENINLLTIYEQINSIIEPKTTAKKLEYNTYFDSKIPQKLIGDKTRIIQVLINLLDNAIKFTKTGSISLKIILEKKNVENVIIKIEVIDTGSGIKISDKNEVYQSFKKLHNSKKIEGSGLGLSIVSSLLNLMNGTINYQTELGKGTSFFVEIPLQTLKK